MPRPSCAADTAVDSWDRLREAAVAALELFPCPLPGLESPAALQQQASDRIFEV